MTESQFKTKVVRYIKSALPGAWVYHPSDKWVSGIPDLFILYRGVFAAIELKVGKNKPSKLQLITLERLTAAGAITHVCWTMPEVQGVALKIKMSAETNIGVFPKRNFYYEVKSHLE